MSSREHQQPVQLQVPTDQSQIQQQQQRPASPPVDLNQKIREVIPWVVSHYRKQPEKCREVLYHIIRELQLDAAGHAIKRLYINYYLCELIINYIDEPDVKPFFLTVFPLPLQEISREFLRQLLSLSICLNNKQILNALAHYVEQNELQIQEHEIKCFPANLASNCPEFVITLIDQGVFDGEANSVLYTTDLLNSWLTDLNSLQAAFKLRVEGLLRYSLIGRGSQDKASSLLHYNLLQMLQKKLVHRLPAPCLLDIAARLSGLPPDSTPVQKFLQVLIVLLQAGLIVELNVQFAPRLLQLLPNNFVLRSILNV